jgi:hypothetical protein
MTAFQQGNRPVTEFIHNMTFFQFSTFQEP